MNREPIFSTRDVRVFVDDKPIVKGVDLDVYPGEKHALMGPNGSGKSTVARCIVRLIDPTSGEVLIDGTNIAKMSQSELRAYRRDVQVVFQGHRSCSAGTDSQHFGGAQAFQCLPGSTQPDRQFLQNLCLAWPLSLREPF